MQAHGVRLDLEVIRELQVQLVHEVTVDYPDPLANRDLEANLVKPDHQVPLDLRAMLVQRETLDQQARLDKQERKGAQDLRVHRDQRVMLVLLEHLVLWVLLVLQDPKEILGQRDQLALKEIQDQKDPQEIQVHQEVLDSRVIRVHKDPKDKLVQQDPEEMWDQMVIKDRRVLLDLWGRLDQQVHWGLRDQ